MNEQKQIKAKLTLHFNLRCKRSDYTNIYAVVNCNGKQTKIPTGLFVKPQQWDIKTENVNLSLQCSKLDLHNNEIVFNVISRLRFLFNKNYLYFYNTPDIWSDYLNLIKMLIKKLNSVLNENGLKVRKTSVKNTKQESCINWLLSAIDKDTLISESSKGIYEGKLRIVQDYERQSGQTITSFEMINNEWLEGYYNWLITRVVRGKLTQTSTANKTVEILLTLLRRYGEKAKKLPIGYTRGLEVINKLKADKNVDEIALTDEEVLAIYHYECEGMEEVVRDMFVLNCLCGQRISDVCKIVENYRVESGKGYTSLVQKKTKTAIDVSILFPLADEIIKKYVGKKIDLPITQRFDEIIKKIAKNAGINGTVYVKKQYCGQRTQTIEKERWECVSSHTARRTFITLLSLRGWNESAICDYSGHTDINMVRLYSKTTARMREQFNVLAKDKRLQMYGEEASEDNTTAKIDDYKPLLAYIGVEACEYEEIKDIDQLCRLFYKNEAKLLDSGIDLQTVKNLYNTQGKTLREKREALKALLK